MALRRYEISLLVLKNISQMSRRASEIVQQEKRNFVSSCGHVMSSVHYFKQMIPPPTPFLEKFGLAASVLKQLLYLIAIVASCR